MKYEFVPTPQLQWIDRRSNEYIENAVHRAVVWETVLQQWWAPDPYKDPDHADGRGEWRDVPTVDDCFVVAVKSVIREAHCALSHPI